MEKNIFVISAYTFNKTYKIFYNSSREK